MIYTKSIYFLLALNVGMLILVLVNPPPAKKCNVNQVCECQLTGRE